MAENGGRLLGLYDELTTFLTQLNLYRGKGLSLTHEMAVFLQLYNGHSWTHATGNDIILITVVQEGDLVDGCSGHGAYIQTKGQHKMYVAIPLCQYFMGAPAPSVLMLSMP